MGLVLVMIGLITVTVLFSCSFMLYKLIQRGRLQGEDPPEPLFDLQDRRATRCVKREGGAESDDGNQHGNEELPDSPYEAEYPHL
jgi:hypothetical protein